MTMAHERMEHALWHCPRCSAAYRIKLFRCPRCTFEEENDMPKITREMGASDAQLNPPTPEDPRTEVSPREASMRELLGDRVAPRRRRDPLDEVSGDGSGDALPPMNESAHPDGAVEVEVREDAPEPKGDDTEPEDEQAGAVSPRPATTAPKSEWVAYVEARTGQRVPANTTRAELIEMYGD